MALPKDDMELNSMKKFAISLAALVALAAGAVPVQAGELRKDGGQSIDLGTLNGVAYYTVEKGGYRVVVTMADATSKAVRFESVLAPGQSVVLSSPAGVGKSPARVEISRAVDSVNVQARPLTN